MGFGTAGDKEEALKGSKKVSQKKSKKVIC